MRKYTQCHENQAAYFYKVSGSNGKTAKRDIWSSKYAIFPYLPQLLLFSS